MCQCRGFLTTDVQNPRADKHPQGLDGAFDDGAELNTITRVAWLKHCAGWAVGHQPYNESEVGPTHGIDMKTSLTLAGFHGDETRNTHMVLVHLHLRCACYPIYCAVVDTAPVDIVLGLGLRRKHNAPYPDGYPPYKYTKPWA